MQFNSDSNKQVNEAVLSRKSKILSYPPFTFNNNDVKKSPHPKHLGIILDSKLDFNIHVDNKTKKLQIIYIIKRLSVSVPREVLLAIYKFFIRPHLDHGDILYDKSENQNFQNKF